jgi:hypothetical protein
VTGEEMMTRLLELEGYLAHLDRVREKFHVDLARVESEKPEETSKRQGHYRARRITGPRVALAR